MCVTFSHTYTHLFHYLKRFVHLFLRSVPRVFVTDACDGRKDAKAHCFGAAHQVEAVLQTNQRGTRSRLCLLVKTLEVADEDLGGEAQESADLRSEPAAAARGRRGARCDDGGLSVTLRVRDNEKQFVNACVRVLFM